MSDTNPLRASAVVAAAKMLRLADEGSTLWLVASDAERWERMKALAPHARIRLAGHWDRVCEMFLATVGDIEIHACGPSWEPSDDELHRLYDQRVDG